MTVLSSNNLIKKPKGSSLNHSKVYTIAFRSISFLQNNYSKHSTFLTKILGPNICKRSMMASGTILTVLEKKLAVAVLTTHLNLLRKKEPSPEDFLDNIVEGLSLHGKTYQHFITILYPGVKFEAAVVKNKFSNIGFDNQEPLFSMDYTIAAAAGYILKKEIPFSEGSLIVCDSPSYPFSHRVKLDESSPAFQQTNQHFPDYIFAHKKYDWYRYCDLKTGQISSNTGHLKFISDPTEYEKESKQLFLDQCNKIRGLYPDSDLHKKMLELKSKMNKEDWNEIYFKYKTEIATKLYDYPKFNPSLIYKPKLSYEIENQKPNKTIDGIINTKTCSSLNNSQEALKEILRNSSQTIQNNYKRFNPLGFGEKNGLGSKMRSFIEDVLS